MSDAHNGIDPAEQLSEIATRYYVNGLTQEEIAKELGVSRAKVYRMIKEAHEENLVEVVVRRPVRRDPEQERWLCDTFGLREAHVIRTDRLARAQVLPRLAQLAAKHLQASLKDGQTLAVCLGSSTYEVGNAISPSFQARVRVAQATGSMSFTLEDYDAASIARRLGTKLGGEVLYLASPHTADTVEAAQVMMRQPVIARAIMAARNADMALVGIGTLGPDSRLLQSGSMSPDEAADILSHDGVGDIAGQVVTYDGKLHPAGYNARVIGIGLEDLRRIPHTLAIAIGRDKARAIAGALRSGAVDVLCTDDEAVAEMTRLAKVSK
jgi:DNA-binding transcriptional regulator LsrR (DeoR family)